MDQDAYHRTFRQINERSCLFEKALLANHCNCSVASRIYLAERVGVRCGSDQGWGQCQTLLELLLQHARFTLKLSHEVRILPHAKAMRLQVGGLRGLHCALHPADPPPESIDDIFQLVGQAAREFDALERLPFQEIIKQVAAYKGRSRRSPK